jgi:pimeloyl-ACP methyl ester carboxylesterase
MRQRHHVIYVPGLLDDIYHAQSLVFWFWRFYGVHSHTHPMPWAGEEPFESKFQRLLDEIDKYADKGHKVSLVGASAGASAVINAYVERKAKIHRVVYICGKINGPETVSPKTYAENPAFETSMYLLQRSLSRLNNNDKQKFHSYYTPTDQTVPYKATIIPGVPETKLPNLCHGQAIFYSLTLGAPKLIRQLKYIK